MSCIIDYFNLIYSTFIYGIYGLLLGIYASGYLLGIKNKKSNSIIDWLGIGIMIGIMSLDYGLYVSYST